MDAVVRRDQRWGARLALLATCLTLLTVGVASGTSMRGTAALAVFVTFAVMSRTFFIGWPRLVAGLILIILFIPIRRYSLPANLPFQLEPYRIFVAFLVAGWAASLLVDHRTRLRRTGFEAPLLLIIVSVIASDVANSGRVSEVSSEVDKRLMFLASFVLVLYVTTTVIRRLDAVDFLARTLVLGGAVVAFFAIVEARTGFNVFNHLSRVIPFLQGGSISGPAFQRVGTARIRVFASAEHPIALSAALVMLTPLAFYLAHRYRQKRWLVCSVLFVVASVSTLSRTGIMMFLTAGLVFIWLRPREVKRLWPALLVAPIAIHFALPGTLGALKASFSPPGGLVAQQQSQPGTIGSGRLADIGPSLQEWRGEPLFGEGYATRVVDPTLPGPKAEILDDQWLTTLLETGAIGFAGWIWFFFRVIRRLGREAKEDDSSRGWLLACIAAGVASYAVGMLTYDAFSFIQVTFLLFIFVGLGSTLLAERPTPLAERSRRLELRMSHPQSMTMGSHV